MPLYVCFSKQAYKTDGLENNNNFILNIFAYTVEIRWLELIGSVSASLTHRWVRGIPALAIFKVVHVYQ